MTNKNLTMAVLGAAAGLGIFGASQCISNYHAVVQEQLARAPELTQETYNSATASADNLAKGHIYVGWISAICAGGLAASALYHATKRDKKEETPSER